MVISENLQSYLLRFSFEEKDFIKNLDEIFGDYQQELKTIDLPKGIDKKELQKVVKLVCKTIIRVVELSYDGRPYQAYKELGEFIGNSQFSGYWTAKLIPVGTHFYRMRIEAPEKRLERKELFHIPYEERGKVSSQRYSIPGYPCLYLSNGIYTAWEELGRKNPDRIHAVRLMNTRDLNIMDLSNTRLDIHQSNPIQLSLDLLMWPFVIASSVKVSNPEDTFKPEYIIPQLLLQWIRMNHKVDGIRFSSTHVNPTEERDGVFTNLVIPVVENGLEGYCQKLAGMFNMSNVLSWQSLQISTGAANFSYTYRENEEINSEIKRIEMIKGRSLPYSFSPLAQLERTLKTLPALEIKFEKGL